MMTARQNKWRGVSRFHSVALWLIEGFAREFSSKKKYVGIGKVQR